MKKYTAAAEIMARGAASLMVRTGSQTSKSTKLMLVYPMKDLQEVVNQYKIYIEGPITLYKPLTKTPGPVPDPSGVGENTGRGNFGDD